MTNPKAQEWEKDLKLYLTSAGDRRRTIAFIRQLLAQQREEIVSGIDKEIGEELVRRWGKHSAAMTAVIGAILRKSLKTKNE